MPMPRQQKRSKHNQLVAPTSNEASNRSASNISLPQVPFGQGILSHSGCTSALEPLLTFLLHPSFDSPIAFASINLRTKSAKQEPPVPSNPIHRLQQWGSKLPFASVTSADSTDAQQSQPSSNGKAGNRVSTQPSAAATPILPSSAAEPESGKKRPRDLRERMPQWLVKTLREQLPAPLWVILSPPGQPDKKRLMTVHDFFMYTEEQGRRFFEELDADNDKKVTLEDMKAAMRRRNLPEQFAVDFVKAARGGRWWDNSITWQDFKGMMDAKEPKILKSFTALELAPSGILEINRIKGALQSMGLPATDDNAKAMLKVLGGELDGLVSYSQFRNFCLLLPDEKLQSGTDPSTVWFESATMVPLGPPPAREAGTFLLKAALAGGIASGGSTFMLAPIDALKTRVQSTPGATFLSVLRSVPKIGVRSLYRGIIPATTGTFVGHGVRTFAYEATLKLLAMFAGGAAELQGVGIASGVSTLLGTSIRIPCEVMKQRLQIGQYDNMLAAFQGAVRSPEGWRGLFRGTTATLSREVPFYMFGMMGYTQLKKAAFSLNGERELAPWQTIAVGALAGAMAAVLTTPADVLKTRIITAPANQRVNAGAIFVDIVQKEGVLALFKGCLFRMAWTAPQGAMNFAGYELAKRALTGNEDKQDQSTTQPSNATTQPTVLPTDGAKNGDSSRQKQLAGATAATAASAPQHAMQSAQVDSASGSAASSSSVTRINSGVASAPEDANGSAGEKGNGMGSGALGALRSRLPKATGGSSAANTAADDAVGITGQGSSAGAGGPQEAPAGALSAGGSVAEDKSVKPLAATLVPSDDA